MNRTEQAAIARYPELARLFALKQNGGWVFQPVCVDGEVACVLDKLIDLPHPDAPTAPKLVIGRRRSLWLPGMPI